MSGYTVLCRPIYCTVPCLAILCSSLHLIHRLFNLLENKRTSILLCRRAVIGSTVGCRHCYRTVPCTRSLLRCTYTHNHAIMHNVRTTTCVTLRFAMWSSACVILLVSDSIFYPSSKIYSNHYPCLMFHLMHPLVHTQS